MHRFAPVDGLRAVAIGMVLVAHLSPHLTGGDFGVDIFFAISGFVITSTLLNERARTGDIDLKRFFGRRILRLHPTLLAFVVIGFAWALVLGLRHALGDAVAALTYTRNFYRILVGDHRSNTGVTWSLACEEQFYLLWPAVMALIVRRRPQWLGRAIFGSLISMILVNVGMVRLGVTREYLFYLPTTRLPQLLVGVATAWLVEQGVPDWARRVIRSPLVPAALLLGLAWYVPSGLIYQWRGAVLGYFAFPIGTCLMILHFVTVPRGVFASLFSWRPLPYVGLRSYAIYLFHSLPLTALETDIVANRFDTLRHFVIVVGFALVAAELSWRYIEVPAARLKRRVLGDTELALGGA